jgi:hypothetical protein
MRRPFPFPAATAHEWGGKAGRPSEPAGSTRSRRGRDGSRWSCEEVGYIPFDPEAAALLFALVSSRYEPTSLIVNSNKTFAASAEMFSGPMVVAAMMDPLVHHAEVIALKSESIGRHIEISPFAQVAKKECLSNK